MADNQSFGNEGDDYIASGGHTLHGLIWIVRIVQKPRLAGREGVGPEVRTDNSWCTHSGCRSLACISLRNYEFEATVTVRHGREPIVHGNDQRPTDGFMGHTVDDHAANPVGVLRLRVLCECFPYSEARRIKQNTQSDSS